MNIQSYLQQNNLPEFLSTWQEIREFTGKPLQDLPGGKPAPAGTLAAELELLINKYKPAPVMDENRVIELIKDNCPDPVMDESKIIDLIKNFAPVKTIEIKNADTVTKIDGAQHCEFEKVLKMVNAPGISIYLYGPAGTGKTQLAENCAIALNKKFYSISVCAQSTKSDLLGFIGAGGNYITSLFRTAYEFGGVFLLDEIDNGNPNVLAVLNSALANGYCAFPDGMVKRHNDFKCIAAANTFGTGANREYVGRNQLDAATLNRFTQFCIGYDENLEVVIFGEVAKEIQAIRRKLTGERVIISMRNIKNTVALINAGFTKNEAIELAVINTIPENLRIKI